MENKQDPIRVMTHMKFLLPTLANSEKKAAEYLLAHPAEMASISLVDYTAASGSSQAAIIRLCQRIGFSGFAQMKSALEAQLNEETIQPSDFLATNQETGNAIGIASIINNVFEVNLQILKETYELVSGAYEEAFQALLSARQIAFFGIGDAFIPCSYANLKFRRIGYTCYADTDADMQIIDACNLSPGDVALAVSHSGNSRQIVHAMEFAKEKGAITICITKLDKSPLAKLCSIKLFTATSDVSIGKEIVARRIAEHAILEALYLSVVKHKEVVSVQKLKDSSRQLKVNKL